MLPVLPQDHPSVLPFEHNKEDAFTQETGLIASGVDAIFTPSIQGPQARRPVTGFKGRQLPKGWKPEDLNVLNPDSRMYYLPTLLYSAGVAWSSNPECIFSTQKDQKARFVVGDSGGFQFLSGSFDLAGKADGVEKISKWQSDIGVDVAMPLDVPTAMIGMKEHTHINTLRDCLVPSINNLKKFLCCDSNLPLYNILHGQTRTDQETWYEAVKSFMAEHPDRMQGWAFPSTPFGAYHCDWGNVLYRICRIIQDGLIGNNPHTGACVRYLHFLGTGTPKTAAILSILSEQLNGYLLRQGLLAKPGKRVNPAKPQSVVVSYDTSNPYTMATRHFQYISSPHLDPTNMTVKTKTLPNKMVDGYAGSSEPATELAFSPIGADLLWGDIIVKRDDDQYQRDAISELIVGAHNTYALFCLMEQGKELLNKTREYAEWYAPSNVIDTVDIIFEMFGHDDPMSVFEKHDSKLGVIK
jgi:hypothetical protein